MADDTSFQDLIRQVRAGDEKAAAELVRRYEQPIRVIARAQLSDPRLRRLLDSMDICQSVLANFFARAAMGQFDLERPENVLKLLATMARNKVKNHAAQQQAARRDCRRVQAGADELIAQVADGPTPSRVVANQELLHELRRRLTDDERVLADERAQGRAWDEIAAERGGSPDGLRMQLRRALDRVTRELGLEN